MVDKKLDISPSVKVTETAPKKFTLDDKRYTEPHPELYEDFKDHPTIQKLLLLSKQRAHIAVEAEQQMGLLDKDVKAGWPSNVELAKRRTLGRRKNMTKEQLAIWEASRSGATGVPPADVQGDLTNGYIIEN